MQIIVRRKGSEPERRKSEGVKAILRRYHEREVRDGARARFPASKETIKRLYQEQ